MKEPMMSATTKAVAAVVIFGVIQLALILYSSCHPWINAFVTASFVLSMIFSSAVYDYHSRKMRALEQQVESRGPGNRSN
jgi:hypothetical protein